jgi:hypothetical protein
MGIDIYVRWRNQTKREKELQITGFSVEHGHVGYLREAYHGEPYATQVLVPEAFHRAAKKGSLIPASVLRGRLPQAIGAAVIRERTVYHNPEANIENCVMAQSLRDFVDLCERKEHETGEPCRIVASY